MDDRARLREKLSAISKEIEVLQDKRHSIETTLQILEEDDAPAPVGRPTKQKGTPPDPSTNVGRAIQILRLVAPQGLTLLQLIEKSAENGKKAFVGTSIGSQLRFQVKRGHIKKTGDTYYAVMS
ncbi:MAG: hypothetical protein K2Y42_06390 [Hyphomicrobium sp.]|uniref:hypothetical protein n=1 Tax=Hyphomicrobium sp. TaxID=82 RepID=UPI0025BC3CD1|nr:hypothetical protein [Hyphomicrobium sp.]MBX9862366.1 hypothetical protein [Hyphomicrobium sp.]